MASIRFFTDEDVYGSVAPALRQHGYDAVSTPEAGRLAESDDSQMQWVVDQQRCLVTFNVKHFAHKHRDWLRDGKHHYGIVVSQQKSVGDVLRRLLHLAASIDRESMKDRLEYLSSW